MKRMLNAAASSFGTAFGAVAGFRAGDDAYDAAKRAVRRVDWKGLKDDVKRTAGRAADSAKRALGVEDAAPPPGDEGEVYDFEAERGRRMRGGRR